MCFAACTSLAAGLGSRALGLVLIKGKCDQLTEIREGTALYPHEGKQRGIHVLSARLINSCVIEIGAKGWKQKDEY